MRPVDHIYKKRNTPSPKNALILLNLKVDRISKCVSYKWDENRTLSDVEFYTIILEDRRFLHHNGFDPLSALREIMKAVTVRKCGGASTLDMQFVRVSTGDYNRSLARKAREVLLALLLKWHASKLQVLRSYLDIAYFGSGLEGAEAAAQKVFGRPSSELRGYDAAFIASMLVYPRSADPSALWFTKVNRRARYGLRVGSRLEKRFKEIGVR